jgi:tripartite-type tricarboxylate transporter receptor subunit TctC
MRMPRSLILKGGALLLGVCAGTAHAAQTAYPTHPIRMLAPEPGGGNEIAGRAVAQALSDGLGQNVVVENRGAALASTALVAGEVHVMFTSA